VQRGQRRDDLSLTAEKQKPGKRRALSSKLAPGGRLIAASAEFAFAVPNRIEFDGTGHEIVAHALQTGHKLTTDPRQSSAAISCLDEVLFGFGHSSCSIECRAFKLNFAAVQYHLCTNKIERRFQPDRVSNV
jgi:hypothetical protein